MNILDICYALKIPEWRHVPILKDIWHRILDYIIIKYINNVRISKYSLNTLDRDETIVVSLTSFPARIQCVEYAIKSLMTQSLKPDRIELWLSEKQFKGIELPASLLELQNYGLEIKYCEDLRGHKKYYEPIKNQKKNEIIITYDDDLIYPRDSISRLMKYHRKYPDSVICNRGFEIKFDEDGTIATKSKWTMHSKHGVKSPVKLLLISNGAGALFPYGSVSEKATDPALIRKYALGVDDLWISLMTFMNETTIVRTKYRNKPFTEYPESQKYALAKENQRRADGINRYDVVIKEVTRDYPKLSEYLKRIY